MPFDFEMNWDCNPDRQKTTLCTGNCENNIWFQNGKCRLDELTYDQVYFILQKNPSAKRDLYAVTVDPNLVTLANGTDLVEDVKEDELRAARIINNPKFTLPFYTLFKGNI